MGPTGEGGATARIRRLRGVRWHWRDDAPAEARAQAEMGVIAQELEAVFPELVRTSPTGVKRVRYNRLVAPLMTTAGELNRRMEALEDGKPTSGPAATLGRVAGPCVSTRLDPDAVARVHPELVREDREGRRRVAYEGLVGLLVEAVKELDARLTALEKRSAPPPVPRSRGGGGEE
jgi:hypothetical protein